MSTINVSSTYTVAASDTLDFTNEMAFRFVAQTGSQVPTVINNGDVTVTANSSYSGTSITGAATDPSANSDVVFWDRGSGSSFSVTGNAAAAVGFSGSRATFTNEGSFSVSSNASALGVDLASGRFSNSGTISVTGAGAGGVKLAASLLGFDNAGSIQVQSTGAGYGIDSGWSGTAINNTGRIVVTDNILGDDSAAIVGRAYSFSAWNNPYTPLPPPASTIVNNSGLIQGDFAFKQATVSVQHGVGPQFNPLTGRMNTTPPVVFDEHPSHDIINNSGAMVGIVQLGDGDDEVHNSGVIVGNVYLGLGANLYDGVFGAVYGTVYGSGFDTMLGGAGSERFYFARFASGGGGADTLVGSSGADVLRGDDGADLIMGAGHADTPAGDTLTGGAGDDTFRGTGTELGDATITDFTRGDVINVSDASFADYGYQRLGTYLNVALTKNVTLANNPVGHLLTLPDPHGGVDLVLGAHVTNLNDFNGDGHSDLIWRNRSTGEVSTWQFRGNVTPHADVNVYHSTTNPPGTLEGTMDFTGEGTADLVWRDAVTGALQIQASGVHGDPGGGGAYSNTTVAPSWHIAGFGDFNGDGRDEIFWRHDDGTVSEWRSTDSGFVENAFAERVDTSWHIQAIADFTGDGKSDVLWRNSNGTVTEWAATATGFAENTFMDFGVPLSWHVNATGDFNGDGKDDILWRSNEGVISIWTSTGTGFAQNTYSDASVSNVWRVVGAWDFNDDGKADILWRGQSGDISVWLSNGSGFVQNAFTSNGDPNWALINHPYDIV